LNHLWSPWRMNYIQNDKKEEGCIFCKALIIPDGVGNLVLYRGQAVYIILNRYPYTSGHMMIVPMQHTASLNELQPEARSEMIELTTISLDALYHAYQPQGYNLGMNLGEVAGAGIAAHIHMHIVPRWAGDTNFMSTTADTRVLPEALEITYHRLLDAWKTTNLAR
jgi:ATP adenylyltransferase